MNYLFVINIDDGLYICVLGNGDVILLICLYVIDFLFGNEIKDFLILNLFFLFLIFFFKYFNVNVK